MWRGLLRNSLITLTVVIGTNIEKSMVFAIVPTDEHILLLHEREEIVATLRHLSTMLHLSQKPRAGNHSVRLQEFKTGCSTHLTADDTLQIFLYRQLVDS